METKTLLNDKLDQDLSEKGYAVFPLLPKDEIEDLKAFFYNEEQLVSEGFYASSHNPQPAHRSKVNAKIIEIFEKYVNQYFSNCISLGGTFISKGSGEKGKLDPHQDWNILNEEEFRAFNVWVPLVDVTPENGCIYLVEKSHKFGPTIRGANIPSPFAPALSTIWECSVPIPMKAGEALVYDLRTLHASPVNQTNDLRLAVVFGIMPSDAEMRYYFKENDKIGVYASNVDFYMKENIFQGPTGLKKIQDLDYDFPVVEGVDFKKWYFEKVLKQPFPEQPENGNSSNGQDEQQPSKQGLLSWIKSLVTIKK